MTSDPRLSDEVTGLPPLAEVERVCTMVLMAWDASEGIVTVEGAPPVAVRYLHARGLADSPDGGTEWVQFHIAVPVEHALDVAAALAKGTTTELGADG